MDIKDLKLIVKICETKSFSASAKLLFVSQPALSQSVKRLEHELGLKLFYRNQRHLEVTEAGKYIYNEAQQIIPAMERLEKNIARLSGPNKETITLGISQFYGRHFLRYFVDIFNTDFHKYQLNVVEGESHFLETQIVNGKIDFGFFPYPIAAPELTCETVFVENILLAVHKNNQEALKLLQPDENSARIALHPAFKNTPFILLKKGLKLRTLALELCKEFNFSPQAVFESENLDTVLSLVENNYGLAFLPNTILLKNHSSDVLFFKINSKLAYRELALVYNPYACQFANADIDKLISKLQSTIKADADKSVIW